MSAHMTENGPVNMLHVELLHNGISELSTWTDNATTTGFFFAELLSFGLDAPYLMNEMLAYSALHLSIVKPERRDFYRNHAAQLQMHALNQYNLQSPHINDQNCVSVFVFAAFLGLHMLCDTLVFREDSFEAFLDRFLQYVRLHRGVRTIASEGRWSIICQNTTLQPLLELGSRLPPMDAELGPNCRILLERIQTSETEASNQEIYKQAIQALHSVMTIVKANSFYSGGFTALTAWPVLVPREYVDLLSARHGEALVILAYYGALVHTGRQSWMFQDGGQFLIRSVFQYLGPSWSEWLEWPLGILDGTILI
ncbi:hypothetical protein N7495_001186 [Penicillium taxi]|uniref:uncharacterized protein n=1 Tax=Penicillium taxi TaxID=168475 RepID=UPI0025453245|nr:uncharacterized protein N7495_001186 [Penicillium taxi]KAJ5908504.1 hypothetical protein N7495_001186 [Penicillium taxi]